MIINKKIYTYIILVMFFISILFNIYQYSNSYKYKKEVYKKEKAFKEEIENNKKLLENQSKSNQELLNKLDEKNLEILNLKSTNKNFWDSLDKYKRLYGNIYYYDIYSFKYIEQPENYYSNSKAIINIFDNKDNSFLETLEIVYNDDDKFIGMGADFNICIFDANFDGVDDILISVGSSGASYGYWAYIFENGKYEYSESFSEIPSPMFDIESKRILGSTRSSANLHSHMVYEFVNGKFEKISKLDLTFTSNGKAEFTEYKIVDDKAIKISNNIFDSFENSIYYDDYYWGLASDRWKDVFEYSDQLLN